MTSEQVVETLLKARELIISPTNWVRNWAAMDVYGNPTYPTSSVACKWCLTGAIEACSPSDEDGYVDWSMVKECEDVLRSTPSMDAFRESYKERGPDFEIQAHLVSFNDHGTHGQVIKLLNEGIEHAANK